MTRSRDSFATRAAPDGAVGARFSLPALAARLGAPLDRLPYCLRVLLENLLRHEDGETVTADDIRALAAWAPGAPAREVAFHPARVLMPDSSGVPLVADLAALRDAFAARGADPARVSPLIPVDIVIDHSVMVDAAGRPDAAAVNLAREMERNRERFAMLRWAQRALSGVRVVPPGNGILHQINLEYLAEVVREQGGLAYPDSLVGMDSHTPMVNALGVFGWGVGGIEAASAMLGQPISLEVPRVVGCRLAGRLRPGVGATDLVLTLTQRLRAHGAVGKFVEFCGPGVAALALPDRATVANMAVEWGATMGFFPIDGETLRYLAATGRAAGLAARVEAYARAQLLWRDGPEPAFDERVELDLAAVEPSLAGPRRPEDRVALAGVAASFRAAFPAPAVAAAPESRPRDGDVVIAAITSCTNTANPAAMVAAGLLARNAVRRGLAARPWVKTSLSPGSRRVSEYLAAAGLQAPLDALGFHVVGHGCMTCMGNSGDLAGPVAQAVREHGRRVAAVLSGNRNFEARIHPLARANYLASPALVVAYALAGTVLIDLEREPLGTDGGGAPAFLRELWPGDDEVRAIVERALSPALFARGYARLFEGDGAWRALAGQAGATFPWDPASTYLQPPPYVALDRPAAAGDIVGARALVMLGDSITTDHISPVGAIDPASDAGRYLAAAGVAPRDFNALIARRGNPGVMARATFSNIRLRNEMAPGHEGPVTIHHPGGERLSVFEAAERYRREGVPLVVIAGRDYGVGSSRDTAAKGVQMLGVRAVIAEGFERIHRSNLVGMGVLPLQFAPGASRRTLGLDGSERFDLLGLGGALRPRQAVALRARRRDGTVAAATLTLRVDTAREADWIRAGGVLPYVAGRLRAAG